MSCSNSEKMVKIGVYVYIYGSREVIAKLKLGYHFLDHTVAYSQDTTHKLYRGLLYTSARFTTTGLP